MGKAARLKKEKEEINNKKAHDELAEKMKIIQLKEVYIKNLINGRYHRARANMIGLQLNAKKIEEKFDGVLKTEELMWSEYAVSKLNSIGLLREAEGIKKLLINQYGLKEEDFEKLDENYINGKIVVDETPEKINEMKQKKETNDEKNKREYIR